MTQSRIYNFGATLTQAKTKSFASNLFGPGTYAGFQPTVVGTDIEFSAGSFLLANGVLVEESDVTTIAFPVPALATDYTITAEHGDIQAIGGSAVSYVLQTGLLPRSGSPDASSLALCWIRHPGAAALSQSMLSAPLPALQTSAPSLVQLPFPSLSDQLQGSNITAVGASHASGVQVLGMKVSNTATSGLQQLQFRVPVEGLPRSIQVYADIPALGSISIDTAPYETYLSNGTVLPTSSAIVGAATGLDPATTPAGEFVLDAYDSSTPITSLGFTIVVPPSDSVFIRALRFVED